MINKRKTNKIINFKSYNLYIKMRYKTTIGNSNLMHLIMMFKEIKIKLMSLNQIMMKGFRSVRKIYKII
jgi:hypothetical protein